MTIFSIPESYSNAKTAENDNPFRFKTAVTSIGDYKECEYTLGASNVIVSEDETWSCLQSTTGPRRDEVHIWGLVKGC